MTVIAGRTPQSLAGLLAGSLGAPSRHGPKPFLAVSGRGSVFSLQSRQSRSPPPGFVIMTLVSSGRHQSHDHHRPPVLAGVVGQVWQLRLGEAPQRAGWYRVTQTWPGRGPGPPGGWASGPRTGGGTSR